MASTIAFYTGDGATTDFTVPFGYLAKKFVRVSLGVTILKGGDYGDTSKDYYFLDKTKVRLKVPPASGEVLTIRRYTSATDRVVSFKDASVLKATDLDVSSVQTSHIAEEARDIINDALIKDKEGNWDAKGNRIVNVGTPEADSDAVTYGVYKADALGAYQSKLDAERARDRAVESETNSKKSEDNSKLSEESAQASADTAVSASEHADAVMVENQAILQEAKEIRDENRVLDANTKDNANVAQVKANEAKVSETNAKKSEVNSKESEGNSKASEGKASTSAELAKQWATKLGDTVDDSEYSAKYYANKAKESATEGSTTLNEITTEGAKQVKSITDTASTELGKITSEGGKQVGLVSAQGTTSVNAVKAQQTTSVNAVTAEGTKQVGSVTTEGTRQVNLAKAQATIATQQATLATTKASEAKASATAANADATKAKASATNATNSASTSTAQATVASNSAKAAKLSADNAALSKTAAGTSETNAKASEVEAKKQADLAKDYAKQSSSGQVNADWNETVSTSKAFIKNKPTLGALASKDSIAYSEITGTPPEQDLSGLATKNELQTGLAGKANDATLQADLTTIRESITNVSSKVDGIGDTLSPTYAKKQAILDACDKALNGTNPVNAVDPTFINQLAEKLSKLGTVRPLGFHYLHPYGTVPADSIICNGATYSRSLYKDFFDYITTQGWVKTEAEWQEIATRDNGFCPFYSSGDGSTNFRTPKFAPYQQIAIEVTKATTYHQAGLPNIVGEHDGTPWISKSSGAFRALGPNGTIPGGTSNGQKRVRFDASLCNPIYGRSDTVQPESHEWVMCVVAYGVATNVGSVDIQHVMSVVNAVQAQVGEVPKPQAYVTETHVSGTQGYRVWSDGFIEQWGKVTIPGENSNKTLTFQKPFKNTSYNIQTAGWRISDRHACVMSKTATSVTLGAQDNDNDWYAFGY